MKHKIKFKMYSLKRIIVALNIMLEPELEFKEISRVKAEA